MGSFSGLPDFGRPERYGVVAGYAAHERPGVVMALPAGLSPAGADGVVPLVVDAYLQERDGAVEQFAVVTAAFHVDVPLDTTHHDDRADVLARPAPLTDGVARLVGPTDLGFPPGGLAPQPVDTASGRVLPAFVRLDGVAGELLVGALEHGLAALGAEVWATVHGLAPRCPGTLSVDVDVLLAALGPGPVQPADLEERVVDGLAGVTIVAGPGDARLLASAVVDRLTRRLAGPAFGDHPEGGWVFRADPRVTPGATTLTYDLSGPAPASRLVRLTCDPVRDAASHADVVRRHTAPPLTDGRERVRVLTTMPAMPAGLVAASVRLTAPPAPPARPFTAEATGHLAPPAPTEVVLALAPGEVLGYDLSGAAVLDTDTGPRVVNGPTRHVDGDPTPVLTPADLGLRLLPVDATDSLLAVADVAVTAAVTWAGTHLQTRAVLRPGSPRAWLALPREAGEASVLAEATSRGGSRRTVRAALPDTAVWLDLFSFADPPWPLPGAPVEQPVVVEAAGLRVVGHRADSDWRFLPLIAAPVRDQAGAPQLTLMEVAGTASLMVTTALLVSDDQQAQARAACVAAGAPADVRLGPAPFEAEEAALLVQRGDSLDVLAATTPSGTASQDAAFAAVLDAADLATVHRALAGEPGLLAVRYVLRVAASGPEALALSDGETSVVVVGDASTWRT